MFHVRTSISPTYNTVYHHLRTIANGMSQSSKISKCILQNLGIPDEDSVLAKFIQNLYQSGSTYDQFLRNLNDNGGDEFPESFKKEVYDILQVKDEPTDDSNGSIKKEPVVKEEPSEAVKTEEPNPKIKDEFRGLALPNRQIKTEEPAVKFENKPELPRIGGVYRGTVTNITAFGAFVRVNAPGSLTGLCHILKLLYDGRRVRHPENVVKQHQNVFVKIDDIQGDRGRVSLLMTGIDQNTGVDRSGELQTRGRRMEQPKKKRRLTSPERWEIRQLISLGAARASDYPELNGANGVNEDDEAGPAALNDDDVELDVELNTAEPEFLKGQLGRASTSITPMQILKNPEGLMNRAAMNGSKLAQQVREEKQDAAKSAERDQRVANSDTSDPMAAKSGNPAAVAAQNRFISEWKKLQNNVQYGRKPAKVPISEQRKQLPVYAMRSQLISAIQENQFLVIVGETGSGKTTQIVQYAYEDGLNITKNPDGTMSSKIIGCTQPRRVAAVSVAKRVAEEVGCKVGQQVGYYIRFEDETGPETKIKYMTDGMLQREALIDPKMSKYSLIMLDEAHERTVATDVLFALLKQACKANPDLKVIVTSATLNSEKFSTYFNNCPILQIPGRTYPVETMFSKQPEMDYLAAALDCVMQIHVSEDNGDILVFLTGQEEIDTACEVLYSRVKTLGLAIPELLILPVYSALPSEMQTRIFEPAPPGARKVVLATNIAETSITIDGIRYVVDPGYVKINAYDPRIGMDLLIVLPISQAQANQRAGRAGRTGPGKCFRLYTENAFNNEMLPNLIPEIQRQNLSLTILMLKAMGINDLISFEFMDPPPPQTMVNALHDLYTLDALDEKGYLTQLGRRMAEFPMEPALAKTVIASVEYGCTEEVLIIVAMLSVQLVFYRPKDKQNVADQKKQRFHSIHGDHLTLLNVYRAWELQGKSSGWCKDNFIHERSLKRALDVRKQLLSIMRKFRLPILSVGGDTVSIRKAFCSGFFKNSAKRDPHDGVFNTLIDNTPVSMHPLLSLMNKSVEYVIYHSVLLTTKEYMQCVSVIDGKWLLELAPRFFSKGDPTKPSKFKQSKKITPLYDRFAKDQDAWRLTSHIEAKKKALELLNDN